MPQPEAACNEKPIQHMWSCRIFSCLVRFNRLSAHCICIHCYIHEVLFWPSSSFLLVIWDLGDVCRACAIYGLRLWQYVPCIFLYTIMCMNFSVWWIRMWRDQCSGGSCHAPRRQINLNVMRLGFRRICLQHALNDSQIDIQTWHIRYFIGAYFSMARCCFKTYWPLIWMCVLIPGQAQNCCRRELILESICCDFPHSSRTS